MKPERRYGANHFWVVWREYVEGPKTACGANPAIAQIPEARDFVRWSNSCMKIEGGRDAQKGGEVYRA